MKKRVLLAVTLLSCMAISAHAASSIVGSKHDLASVGSNANATSIHSIAQNQTCVFCHAPHNAITNTLLWNRNYLAGSGMKIYTSFNDRSKFRGLVAAGANNNVLPDSSSSLLCLSCHSLASSADVINNTANGKGGGIDLGSVGQWGATGSMNNLTNDHPINISYDAALVAEGSGGALYDATTVKAGLTGLRLFGSTNVMECASCHSVHDPSNGKFLAINNDNSNLCKKCHNK